VWQRAPSGALGTVEEVTEPSPLPRPAATTVQRFDVTLLIASPVVQDRPHTPPSREIKTVVFLAVDNGEVQGHSLIEPVAKDNRLWQGVGDGAVLAALANARLVELRGLEVSPASRTQGVASALLRSQLTWLAEHPDLLAVAEVWRGDPGISHIAQQLGIWMGSSPDERVDHYKYDAFIAQEYLSRVARCQVR
jgi:GNAT superfamily N-acetyltransferase